MKTVFVILAAIALAGCVGMGSMPTVQNCEEVKYERIGVDIKVEAKCKVPMGGALPGL